MSRKSKSKKIQWDDVKKTAHESLDNMKGGASIMPPDLNLKEGSNSNGTIKDQNSQVSSAYLSSLPGHESRSDKVNAQVPIPYPDITSRGGSISSSKLNKIESFAKNHLKELGIKDYQYQSSQSDSDELKMLNIQRAMSAASQKYSMMSSAMKVKHEKAMVTIRNMK